MARPAFVALVAVGAYATLVTVMGGGAGTDGKLAGRCVELQGTAWAPSRCDAPAALEIAPGDPAPAAVPCGVGDMDAVLATIRTRESGGRYGIGPNAGGASGAYQFIQGTWNGVAPRAGRPDLAGRGPWTASPADQDALARQLVTEAMGGTDDITRVPVVWYIGHIPRPGEWDTVPHPEAGNRLTPRQYQALWMGTFRDIASPCTDV